MIIPRYGIVSRNMPDDILRDDGSLRLVTHIQSPRNIHIPLSLFSHVLSSSDAPDSTALTGGKRLPFPAVLLQRLCSKCTGSPPSTLLHFVQQRSTGNGSDWQ